MINNEHMFVDGLAMLRVDDDGPDAQAALLILGETILLHRKWLRTHIKDQ